MATVSLASSQLPAQAVITEHSFAKAAKACYQSHCELLFMEKTLLTGTIRNPQSII